MSKTIWVVMGTASRVPVAAFTDEVRLYMWLRRRRGTSMMALYRIDEGKQPVVACIHCIIERWA